MKQITPFLRIFLIILCFSCQSKEEVQFRQYVVQGQVQYATHCANCHQKDGRGLADLYPPIVGSKLLQNKVALICAMKNGLKNQIASNAKTYSQAMPANNQLQAIDLALISTYVLNEWNNEQRIVSIDSVQNFLKKCN